VEVAAAKVKFTANFTVEIMANAQIIIVGNLWRASNKTVPTVQNKVKS